MHYNYKNGSLLLSSELKGILKENVKFVKFFFLLIVKSNLKLQLIVFYM